MFQSFSGCAGEKRVKGNFTQEIKTSFLLFVSTLNITINDLINKLIMYCVVISKKTEKKQKTGQLAL